MVPIQKITGRLGNQMFQFARLYALSRKEETDYYYQDPKYFDDYREEIKQLFGQNITPLPYVAIHIRRGKNPINPNEPAYSENPFYVDLMKTDYYQQAIKLFPNEEFLVFSDDNDYAKEWARKNLIKNWWQLDESDNAIDALNRMAGCRGIVMANSSLSFWGAYLGVEKKVIAPKQWYSDGLERTKLLPEWTKI